MVRVNGQDIYLGKHNTKASLHEYDRVAISKRTSRSLENPATIGQRFNVPLSVCELTRNALIS